jgi:hypothetical protein
MRRENEKAAEPLRPRAHNAASTLRAGGRSDAWSLYMLLGQKLEDIDG